MSRARAVELMGVKTKTARNDLRVEQEVKQ